MKKKYLLMMQPKLQFIEPQIKLFHSNLKL